MLGLTALGLAPAALAAEVDAGPLRARTGDDPWSLEFTDRAGRTVLAQAPGAGSGPTGVDTLASYGDRAPVVSLRVRRGRRTLLAFPRGRSAARLDDGGVLRSRERRGEWRLHSARSAGGAGRSRRRSPPCGAPSGPAL